MKTVKASLLLLASLATAQNVTVPSTCTGNFTAGTDEVLYTVPYTYKEVMSIMAEKYNFQATCVTYARLLYVF